jgi:hypothetical protein
LALLDPSLVGALALRACELIRLEALLVRVVAAAGEDGRDEEETHEKQSRGRQRSTVAIG